MPSSTGEGSAPGPETASRRGFFDRLSSWLMAIGLLGGYGFFGALAARFLYPSRPEPRGWLFAAEVDRLRLGESLPYVTPTGESVLITRQGEGESADDFIALSSVCPHLGCRVHWEPHNERFFCPCHNGVFNREGVATGGPPAQDNQNLPRFALKVENRLLFIDVPLRGVPLGSTTV